MFRWLHKLLSSPTTDETSLAKASSVSAAQTEASATALEVDSARNSARQRLKLVLMHDRTQLEQPTLEAMRDEMVKIIAKYVCIDESAIEINLDTDPDTNTIALVASIPVVRGGKRQVSSETEDEQSQASQEATIEESGSTLEAVNDKEVLATVSS